MSACTIVQNFSLPGEVCRKFAVDWSQDNKVCVCTSKAIYIMSSHCSPVENEFPSPYHKQVITAPDKVMQMQPIAMPPNPYANIESLEDEFNIHQILMDHTLNPTPPERSEAFRGYRCARWSPKGAAKSGRCILATLTMDHRLALFEEVKREWICICDLTEVLKTENDDIKKASCVNEMIKKYGFKKKKIAFPMKSRESSKIKGRPRKDRSPEIVEPVSKSEEDDDSDIIYSEIYNYKNLMERTYKVAPVEITWTGMFGSPASSMNEKSSEYCYLIVAMKSGHIQFWKISTTEGRTITLAHEWNSGLGLLTSICWQQTSPTGGFLMCGTLKGIFAFLPVTLRNQDSEQEPAVVVKDMCKVWDEEDHISVDHIAVLKIALKKYVVVAAKQHALVGCEIFLTDSSIIIRNVGHSFGLHKLPITGMSVLDATMPQFRLLISTMEGLFVEIKISLKDDEIKFQHEKMNVDLDLKNMMVQGLAVSYNGILCSVILNTVTYYDHLEKKEPLQFVTFVTKPFDEIFVKLRGLLKPAFSFLSTASTSISRHSDFLECIRFNLACGNPLPDWMMALLEKDLTTNFENISDLELYTTRFLLLSYVSGLASSAPKDKKELEKKLYAVETVIIRKYIFKVFSSCQDKMDLLSPAQGQSLLLMADLLLKEFQMPVDSLYSALGCDVPEDATSLPARETCRICKSEVRLENAKTGQCARKHIFARCCQSLLLCDVIPYHQCASCKSVALQDVWNFSLTCTLCGMTMV